MKLTKPYWNARSTLLTNVWLSWSGMRSSMRTRTHIPTDFVVAQEASDVESSSRLACLWLHNLRRRFIT